MFCSRLCKNTNTNTKNQVYGHQQERGLARKIAFITDKGGRCFKCGYNRNFAALCFHHRDEKTKSFPLMLGNFSNRSLKSLRSEVDKCDILCHNCHMETHYPHLSVSDGSVAQLVERENHTLDVAGSIPATATIDGDNRIEAATTSRHFDIKVRA